MDKKENENRELNEFELALISGGGNASFPAQVFSNEDKKQQLADTVGVNVEQIDQCLKDEGQVSVISTNAPKDERAKIIREMRTRPYDNYIHAK